MSALLERAAAAAQVLTSDLDELEVADADVHHLARALRLRDGEQVVASDGAGRWRLCAWRVDGRGGVLEATGPIIDEAAPASPTTVWLPALKGERAARPEAIALADTVLRTETAAVAAAVTLTSLRRSRHGRATKAS